jgi:hypothetical protein
MMKQSILIVTMAAMLSFCGSCQNKAMKDQEKALAALNATPGAVPVSADGYTMKAKVGGKDWIAVSMMPPELSGTIVGFFNPGELIALPYDRRDLVVGNKTIFGEHRIVRLGLDGDISAWESKNGEMEITKADGKWAEGKFFFTAFSDRSTKTVEVTEGYFRVPIQNR